MGKRSQTCLAGCLVVVMMSASRVLLPIPCVSTERQTDGQPANYSRQYKPCPLLLSSTPIASQPATQKTGSPPVIGIRVPLLGLGDKPFEV